MEAHVSQAKLFHEQVYFANLSLMYKKKKIFNSKGYDDSITKGNYNLLKLNTRTENINARLRYSELF